MKSLTPLVFLVPVALSLAACQDALIYGERTSYSVAQANLNDDVSEPVTIKVGLIRSVAAVAPPMGGPDQQEVPLCNEGQHQTEMVGTLPVTPTDSGSISKPECSNAEKIGSGEAVSVFSKFKLYHVATAGSTPSGIYLKDDDLIIKTQFASGNAAIKITKNPQAVKGIMGVPLEPAEIVDQRAAIIKCVREVDERKAEVDKNLRSSATDLGIPNITTNTNISQVKNFVIMWIDNPSVNISSIKNLAITQGCQGN